MKMGRAIHLTLFAAWCGGCQPDIPGETLPPPTDASASGDASFSPGGGAPAAPAEYPADDAAPTVEILEPADGTELTTPAVFFRARLTDPSGGLAAVSVAVEPNLPVPLELPSASGEVSGWLPVGWGSRSIVVRAWDIAGAMGVDAVTVERPFTGEDQEPPTLWVESPNPGFVAPQPSLLVRGHTADDAAVASVVITVNGNDAIFAQTQDDFTTWAAVVVPPPGPVLLRVTATDIAGRKAAKLVEGTATFTGDKSPPALAIAEPEDGATTTSDSILVRGTAVDESGIVSVEIRSGDGPYVSVTTLDTYHHWEAMVALSPGTNAIRARALDGSGLTSTVDLTVINASGEEWGPPTIATLSWAPPSYASSTFDLDREGVGELISPPIAADLVLLELDPVPLIEEALSAIKNACGAGWWAHAFKPKCPASWSQREINLWRLVTMTPDNANLEGTSIAGVEELADLLNEIGLIDSFSEILAAALDIDTFDTFLSTEAVAAALVEGVVQSHPKVPPHGLIPVTLLDGLQDMTPFGARFDASGNHPGFIDTDAGGTYAEVLEPDFRMTLVASSNLHWHEGFMLGDGKGYLAFVADVTGPSDDDVLEFDFLSPETFSVSGIAPNPHVDLAFKVFEHDSWVSVGNSRFPLPHGNGDAWSLKPWLTERVIADAALREYAQHRSGCDLCSGAEEGALLYEDPVFGLDQAEVVVGRDGYDAYGGGAADNFDLIEPNPAGWMRVWTLFGLGDPPAPQYVWDMILEVAERRLLDGGVAQGDGHALFRLEDVPVGLTGQAIKDAMRPVLESQKSVLSAALLGDYREQGSPVDFYLAKGEDGSFYLLWAHPTDPMPSGTPTHPVLGFYAEVGLQTKVSKVLAPATGDVVHEKLAVGTTATTVYGADRSGGVWRIEIGPLGDTSTGAEVTVKARRWLGVTP